MRTNISRVINSLVLLLLVIGVTSTVHGQDLKGFRSAGALAFGPDGVLFVGDNVGGAIYAFQVGNGEAPKEPAKRKSTHWRIPSRE